MKLFALLALVITSLAAVPQDSGTKPPPPPVQVPTGQTPPAPPIPGSTSAHDSADGGPMLDVDGEVAVAGKFPKSAKPEAVDAFRRILTAGLVPGSERARVTALDLTVDLRYKASTRESNDIPSARFRYLSPRYLRRDAGPGREHLRGDAGDFVIEQKGGEAPVVTDVSVVRNGAEDRRQIDECVALARSFIGFTDPSNLRILALRTLEAPPVELPPHLVERGTKLAWIELETPDFSVPVKETLSRSARVSIGASRATGLPEIVLVDDAKSPRKLNASTLCNLMSKYEAADGFLVPRSVLVYRPDPALAPPSYMREPGIDMIVRSILLHPAFTPQNFSPPR